MTGRGRSPWGEAGFGLVSLLVAMVLLAVGVVALSTSSAFLVSLQTDAAVRSTATSIAVTYMEEVKRRPPGALASEGPTAVDETGQPDPAGRFVRTLTIQDDPATPDVVQATVQVRYPTGFGGSGRVELITVIYTGSG